MGTALQIMPTMLPMGNLDAYMQRINAIPLLSKEEEFDLAARLQNEGSLEAAQKLVLSHIRYVVRIAKGYSGYGLALSDLIQEGSVGLMKAVKRFQPEKGVRLVSYAVHWIKAEIHEFIIKNWRIVKVATTKAQRKLFFNIRKKKEYLGWYKNEDILAVAKDLGVTPKEVREMEKRMSCHDAAFDAFIEFEDSENRLPAPSETIAADKNTNPEYAIEMDSCKSDTNDKFQAAWQNLDSRSQDILSKRWLSEEKATLHELAETYGVSAERIRQLESKAIKAMREEMV